VGIAPTDDPATRVTLELALDAVCDSSPAVRNVLAGDRAADRTPRNLEQLSLEFDNTWHVET